MDIRDRAMFFYRLLQHDINQVCIYVNNNPNSIDWWPVIKFEYSDWNLKEEKLIEILMVHCYSLKLPFYCFKVEMHIFE